MTFGANNSVREAAPPLKQIEDEDMVHEVEAALTAARTDPESLDVCDKRLRGLKMALDQAENALEWPGLVKDAEDFLASAQELLHEHGTPDEKRQLQQSEAEIRQSMQTRHADLLAQRVEALRILLMRLLDKHDVLPGIVFEQLCAMKDQMRDPVRAQKLMAEGLRSLQEHKFRDLRLINQQLSALLPVAPPPINLSTITR